MLSTIVPYSYLSLDVRNHQQPFSHIAKQDFLHNNYSYPLPTILTYYTLLPYITNNSYTLSIVLTYSFIQAISIAPLQINYYSEALQTLQGHCVGISRRSATGNCE